MAEAETAEAAEAAEAMEAHRREPSEATFTQDVATAEALAQDLREHQEETVSSSDCIVQQHKERKYVYRHR